MKRLFDRWKIARALDGPAAIGPSAALDARLAREVHAHRAVEDLLRRQARAANQPPPPGLQARVLARLEPAATSSIAARRTRGWLPAAAALLLAISTWFVLRARVEPGLRVAAPPSGSPASGFAAQLSVLGALPRSSTSTLRSTIDRPLLGEVEKLTREARSLGHFLRLWAPPLALRDGEDGR